MLDNYFDYKKHKTDFKTEVIRYYTFNHGLYNVLNPSFIEFAGPEKVSLISAQFIPQLYWHSISVFLWPFTEKLGQSACARNGTMRLLLLEFVLEWDTRRKKL